MKTNMKTNEHLKYNEMDYSDQWKKLVHGV